MATIAVVDEDILTFREKMKYVDACDSHCRTIVQTPLSG